VMAAVRPLFVRNGPRDLHQRDFHDVAHSA
jgi:hypothetical protein